MVTLVEFNTLQGDVTLQNRVEAACRLECKYIFMEEPTISNHIHKLTWAVKVLRDDGTGPVVMSVFRAVLVLLALNPAYTSIAEIQAVDDDTIRSSVKGIIEHFAKVGL